MVAIIAQVRGGNRAPARSALGTRLVPGWGFPTELARNAGNFDCLAAAENKLPILNCRINVKLFQKLRFGKMKFRRGADQAAGDLGLGLLGATGLASAEAESICHSVAAARLFSQKLAAQTSFSKGKTGSMI